MDIKSSKTSWIKNTILRKRNKELKVKNYVNKLRIKSTDKFLSPVNSCFRAKVNSKAFAIPILTAFAFIMIDMMAVRIMVANALELAFVLY